jgi:Cerato-platanin
MHFLGILIGLKPSDSSLRSHSSTMIYLTTFFLTLFLTHIARALPRGCHNLISPEINTNQHGLTYDKTQFQPPFPLKATFDQTFDNPSGSVNNVACSNGPNGLASKYPTFSSFPNFPYIGGAFDIAWNSPNCGSCWEITNTANNVTIFITAIDTAGQGFNIAKEAFDSLNSGGTGDNTLVVEAWKVSSQPC